MLRRLANFIASATNTAPAFAPEKTKIFEATIREISSGDILSKNKLYKEISKEWTAERKVELAVYLVNKIARGKDRNHYYSTKTRQQQLLEGLMKQDLLESPEAVLAIGRAFLDTKLSGTPNLTLWPIKKYAAALEKRYAEIDPEQEVSALLERYLLRLESTSWAEDARTFGLLRIRIGKLLGTETANQHFLESGDDFGAPMNALVGVQQDQLGVGNLLAHTLTSSSGKPSAGWQKKARAAMKAWGNAAAHAFLSDFLLLLNSIKPPVKEENNWAHLKLVHKQNQTSVKGLLWCCGLVNKEQFSRQLAQVAILSYKKIPGQGPLDTTIGNACVSALAVAKGNHGIGQLAGLSYRIKQTGIRNKVDKIITETAAARNVSRQEIEDLSVQDFGLVGDLVTIRIGEYDALIQLVKPGKSILTWQKDEKTQKSIPKAIKDGYPGKLIQLKATKKALEKDSINLRDRIDWGLRLNRKIELNYLKTVWMANGLLRFFADRLIWFFAAEDGTEQLIAIQGADGWEDVDGNVVDPTGLPTVQIWHPCLATTAEVEAWREYLTAREITQPLKQAFREVYILTAAEENTGTYSNRMAAHILKQHQFANLARGRGWAYSLIGAYDHGMPSQACHQTLTELGIRAEYIILEMNDGDRFNQTGIWDYVATDQVRFLDLNRHRENIPLTEVPPVLLSEILRDTDLFVGVASIGNDDQWNDSGGEVTDHYQTYWTNYSTRDLTASGASRKLALERLVPRLKIRDVATLDDKFLRVTGKLRKYKIHIGSGNILMEPNDQYLCIVPGSYGKSTGGADKVYLPFEGDRTLSIILSKALLLAEDDKITDSTITRQLRR